MKKLIFLFTILGATFMQAQFRVNTTTSDKKWTFGGYAGLGGAFGNGGGTTLYITPRAGYKITDNLEAGVSGNFTWGNSKTYSSTMLGIGPFVNYYFQRTAYLSANFQEFFVNRKLKSTHQKFSDNESALYIGGGYMQRLGNNVYMQIGAMYNVLYKEDSSVFGGAFVPNVGIVYGL